MKHIKHAISGTLIKAALSADTKSEKKSRLMDLYFANLIHKDVVIHFIKTEGLKHE